MTRRIAALVLVALAGAGGCARRASIPVWQPGLSDRLERAAEQDTSLLHQEEWLLESGLAHSFPQSPGYDPEVARERFARLLELFPRTRHRPLVSYLVPLLEEASRKTGEARRTQQEIQQLQQEIAAREARIGALEQKVDSAALRDDRYRTVIMNLQVQLEDRVRKIRELEDKLKGLMQIDLQPRF
jgi:hypothetical protein